MFVSDRVVFTELHKTGGTHIGEWLRRLVGGEQIGKHNRVPSSLWDRFVIGSVRDPWDWYVSLWAFGCSGQGSVRHQLSRRLGIRYSLRQLGPEMGVDRPNPGIILRQCWEDLRKPVGQWVDTYSDPTDAAAFRRWLRMIFDPTRRFDVAEGYGFSPVSSWAGLLTYRYLKLFTKLGDSLYTDQDLHTLGDTRELWRQHQLVRFIIRNECLESDLVHALELAGIELTAQQRQTLEKAREQKTNASKRRPVEHYYDKETAALVAAREALIIEEHAYQPPRTVAS